MYRLRVSAGATLALIVAVAAAGRPAAQARRAAAQQLDTKYTATIKEYLEDSRITTELVDHLPASDTVPTP